MNENLNETNVNVSTTTPQIEIIENTTQETVIVNGEEMTFQQDITKGIGCTKTKDGHYVIIYPYYAEIIDIDMMINFILRYNSKKAVNKKGFKEIKELLAW